MTRNEIAEHWASACIFCERYDILHRVDTCMADGLVKDVWMACRKKVVGLTEAPIAAVFFCSMRHDMYSIKANRFQVCFSSSIVTEDAWKKATRQCKTSDIESLGPLKPVMFSKTNNTTT